MALSVHPSVCLSIFPYIASSTILVSMKNEYICMHYWYISSSWRQKSVGSSYKDSPNYEKWTRCTYPKWTDVKYPKWDVALGALDRVSIPCLMHDTCLCQLELWDWMLKLSMYTSNRKMKKPIYFQGQRSNFKVTVPLQRILALGSLWAGYSKNCAV